MCHLGHSPPTASARCESQLHSQSQIHLPANTHPGRGVMAPSVRSLPSIQKAQTESAAPGFSLVQLWLLQAFFSSIIYYLFFFFSLFLREWVTQKGRNRGRDFPSAGSISKWLQQPKLGQSKAGARSSFWTPRWEQGSKSSGLSCCFPRS